MNAEEMECQSSYEIFVSALMRLERVALSSFSFKIPVKCMPEIRIKIF